jgi:6-phospho-beta-glucosidase
VHIVDVRNEGTVGGMAADDVVELPARVDHAGAHTLPQSPVAPELLGLMQHVAAYERLAALAAVTRDLALVRKALLTHPLIAQDAVTEELMEQMFVGSPV